MLICICIGAERVKVPKGARSADSRSHTLDWI